MRQISISMTYPTRILRILLGLVLVLILVQVAVSILFSSLGKTIRDLQERASTLTFHNQQLEEDIASYTSLTKLSVKSKELGFVNAPVLFLTSHTPLSAKLGQ